MPRARVAALPQRRLRSAVPIPLRTPLKLSSHSGLQNEDQFSVVLLGDGRTTDLP